MKRNEVTSGWAAALAAALIAAGGVVHAAERGEAPDPEFSRLDANRDGYLSRAEARKLGNFDKAFGEADDNRDGRLDAAEFAKAQAIYDRQRAGQFVEDSVITAKVKAALLRDPLVSGVDVSVETHKGAVLLSGFVASGQQARRAAEIAAGVGGVVSVKNSLVVKG
jgi:hyperosmotically inducible protein